MNDAQKKVVALVQTQLSNHSVVTEGDIKQFVDAFAVINGLSTEQKQEVISDLHAKLSVRMDRGACLKERDHVSWYYSAKKDLSSVFWERYRLLLVNKNGFSSDVINALDASTDEMMDMLGNPSSSESFSRRGLVIGDVQSGKTSTYTALINKAADAGYRIIILLTGTIEKLRRQTQARLDEGFVGLDSTAFTKDKNVHIGVGVIDSSVTGWAVTSTTSDFKSSIAGQLSGRLSDIKSPILFVLKKNKSVLEKLELWMRIYNANHSDKKIHLPMLLIDDEADNASVNTQKAEDDPTTINRNIRKLLNLFSHANYVGFTATPYANIFINPDTTDEMLKDDLFPRDFIYALEAPTNYIGARTIFPKDSKHEFMLKNNEDCEYYLPEKHKIDHVCNALPKSMKDAIMSFLLTNAIRDMRGHACTHRSMLINISRFIAVQNQICKSVDGFVRNIQREVKLYSRTGASALKYESLSELKRVYEEQYGGERVTGLPWQAVQDSMKDAIAPVVVRTVNGGNAPRNLNYDENEDEGLRLIAIGGFSLSRGLTLEGLSVSYFYRNSKMYDTLMQMGRWFGYRYGYEDLCQVWMSEDAIAWYRHISEASDELRREVRRMRDSRLTPNDFGLCVRSDIRALLVTAVNKMRTAKDYEMTVSINGRVVETPYLHMDKDINEQNATATDAFIGTLHDNGYNYSNVTELALDHPQILNVPKSYVIDFLRQYKSHYLNMDFRSSDLASIIEGNSSKVFDAWDVMIVSKGNGGNGTFCGLEVGFTSRTFALKKDSHALQMSGKGSRLGSANLSKGGLKKEEATHIEDMEKAFQRSKGEQHAFSQELYFTSGIKRNPLLIIFPVSLSTTSKDKKDNVVIDPVKEIIKKRLPEVLVGLSLGVPRINGQDNVTYLYKINLVKYKELLGIESDYQEIDETIIAEDA